MRVNAQVKKAARTSQTKARSNGKDKQFPVSFGAYRDKIERWTKAAKAIDRPLGWYIRMRLEAMDALDDQRAAQAAQAEPVEQRA
jgi:hypothetical protein